MADNTVPPITATTLEAARNNPGGWVYAVDPDFENAETVPPFAVVGAWRVDDSGTIAGEFQHNPDYRPSLRALGVPDSRVAIEMLAILRYASSFRQDRVLVAHSELTIGLAEILRVHGYLTGWTVEEDPGPVLALGLATDDPARERVLSIRYESEQRVYVQPEAIAGAFAGRGTAIVSTSAGLMTDHQAAERHLGGEVIAHLPEPRDERNQERSEFTDRPLTNAPEDQRPR